MKDKLTWQCPKCKRVWVIRMLYLADRKKPKCLSCGNEYKEKG